MAKLGGNVLCIYRHKEPSDDNPCHQIWASIGYMERDGFAGDHVVVPPEREILPSGIVKQDKLVFANIHIIGLKSNHRTKNLNIYLNDSLAADITHPGHGLIAYQGNSRISLRVGKRSETLTLNLKNKRDYYFVTEAKGDIFGSSKASIYRVSAAKGNHLIKEITRFWVENPMRRKNPPRIAAGGYLSFAYKPQSIRPHQGMLKKKFLKQFRAGSANGIRTDLFIGRNWGIGLLYTHYHTKSKIEDVVVGFPTMPKLGIYEGTLNGEISMDNYGANFVMRFYTLEGRINVTFGAGVNYVVPVHRVQ